MSDSQKNLVFFLIIAVLCSPLFLGQGGGCSFEPSGPRAAVIVRESFDDTPSQAQLWKNMQAGDAHKYLASKQHTLTILDDDETGTDNQPLPLLVKYGLAGKMANGQHTPPELLLLTADGKRLIFRETLAPDATADTVLAAFKAHGG